MKVLMLKDVGGVGQRDTMQEVSDGYALNFLIPQGFAVQATPDRIAALEIKKKTASVLNIQQEQLFREAALKIEGARVEIFAKANEQHHLYKQLTETQIAETLGKQFSLPFEPQMISLKNPIKMLGEFPIEIKMGKDRARCTIVVVALNKNVR